MASHKICKIAIFASGGGSNAREIIKYFRSNKSIVVALVVTNNAKAGVIQIAENAGIPVAIIDKKQWANPQKIISILRTHEIGLIVLAGFLLLIPPFLIDLYKDRIINIHPSLLPKYGGKGMYGHFVHEAVKNSGDAISGITIHLVNEHYDDGKILYQHSCVINKEMTTEEIAAAVLQLEHKYYASVIENYVSFKGLSS